MRGNLANWALRWLRYVEMKTGNRPDFYSGDWFLGPHGCEGNAELGQYRLWLSGYQASEPTPPAGWRHITLWQFTDASTVPGIDGGVDESRWYG
jgi:GH25 family lysozyme M1 (1,4-beta-N-acetylmuramidase)